jgi:hypothetical protein
MKYNLLSNSLLFSVGLCAAAFLPRVAQSASVHFESATDLLNFTHIGAADLASANFSQSATAGTGSSGGVIHAVAAPPQEDTTAIYTSQSFDLTTNVMHTATIDFMTGTVPIGGSANAMAMLGFSANNNTGFYSNAADSFVGGRVRHQSGALNGLQSQTKIATGTAISAPANGSVANIAFISSNWYRLSLSVTRDGNVANQFAYSMTLTDIGPTGTSAPAAVTNGTLAGTFLNADLYSDMTAYAGFRGVPSVTGGNVAFDNFTVIAVPEPAGALLLGLGALGLCARPRTV